MKIKPINILKYQYPKKRAIKSTTIINTFIFALSIKSKGIKIYKITGMPFRADITGAYSMYIKYKLSRIGVK